jgi:hypothetical protein
MNTGMMWFDNDPKTTLTAKVVVAADYYRHKYGCVPTICLVNPKMLDQPEMKIGVITVKPFRSILPSHLWIGVQDNTKGK